jgi:predicted ArsR family transcriptional regulator
MRIEDLQAAGFVEVCGTGWNHARGQTEQIYGLTEKGRRA